MHMNTFGLNVVFIGDYETLKHVYNHPDVQDRLTGTGLEELPREEKRVKCKDFPGTDIFGQSVSEYNLKIYRCCHQ